MKNYFSFMIMLCLGVSGLWAEVTTWFTMEDWAVEGNASAIQFSGDATWRRGGRGLGVDLPPGGEVMLLSPEIELGKKSFHRLGVWMRSFRGDDLFVEVLREDDGEEIILATVRLSEQMTDWTRVFADFETDDSPTSIRIRVRGASGDRALAAELSEVSLQHFAEAPPVISRPGDLDALSGPLDLNQTQRLFIQRRMDASGPAWESGFPLRKDGDIPLTDADVVGPEGLVYPDFRYAGVPGGIPDVPVVVRAMEFGAHPDDGRPDAAGLEAAIEAAASAGGGAVQLEAGVYELDRPIVIRRSGVVLRGAGKNETRVLFTYSGPAEESVGFANVEEGEAVGPGSRVVLHAKTVGLERMRFLGPDETVHAEHGRHLPEWYAYPAVNRPANFTLEVTGRDLLARHGTGEHVFTAEAVYGDRREQTEIRLKLVKEGGAVREWQPSAFTITGSGTWNQERAGLAEAAPRGARMIRVTRPEIFADADYLVLSVRGPEEWFEQYMVEHPVAKGGWLRRMVVGIDRVDGDRLILKQPLRISWDPADGVLVIPWQPVTGVGIERLTLEQTGEKWTSGISFRAAAESWVRDVRVMQPGRNPVDTWDVKHIEVRDAEFDGARYTRGGGGTAYVAWQAAYDCLMTDVRARGLRHAPNVQWSSSGNVFRDSEFEDSGGQWHAGYATENLYENLRIHSTGREGSYAYALFSSIPNGMHGPQGPRNVVRNCTVESHRGGIKLGGYNEGWIFIHNRILARNGPALVILPGAQNLVFHENVFSTLNPDPSPVWIATLDCVGIEFVGNTFLGVGDGEVFSGGGEPERVENQTVVAGLLPPTSLPSLHDWQRDLPELPPLAFEPEDDEAESPEAENHETVDGETD